MGSKSHPTLHRQGWLLGPPIGAVPRRPLLRISPGDSRVLCAAFGKSRKPFVEDGAVPAGYLAAFLVFKSGDGFGRCVGDGLLVDPFSRWENPRGIKYGGGCVGCGGVFCLFFKKGTLCSGNEIQIGVFLNRVGVELGFVAVRTCFCRIGNFGNP